MISHAPSPYTGDDTDSKRQKRTFGNEEYICKTIFDNKFVRLMKILCFNQDVDLDDVYRHVWHKNEVL